MYLSWCVACEYVCVKVSILELQTFVSSHVVMGQEPGSPGRALNHTAALET